jgi:hypothetical protein
MSYTTSVATILATTLMGDLDVYQERVSGFTFTCDTTNTAVVFRPKFTPRISFDSPRDPTYPLVVYAHA